MEYFPAVVLNELKNLNSNLRGLSGALIRASKSSENLQNKLVFWTKIMAGAIIAQIIALIMITFLGN